MKKSMIIASLLLSMAAFAQMNRVPSSNPFNDKFMERKYLGLSVGIDPANALFGGKKLSNGERRNEQAVDLLIRPMFGWEGWGNWEVGIPLEFFPAIDYQSVGVDFNYVVPITNKLIVLAGVEWDYVSRKGIKPLPQYKKDSFRHSVPAANIRGRWEGIAGSRFFIEGHLNYKYRTDIGYFWGKDAIPKVGDAISGMISIGAKF